MNIKKNRFSDLLEEDTPKVKISNKPINHTVLVIDKSGSMTGLVKETIEGINAQIIVAKEAKEVSTRLSIITFNSTATVLVWDTSPFSST